MVYTNHLIHVYFEYITVAQYTFRLDQVTFHIHLLGKSRRFRCMIKLCK